VCGRCAVACRVHGDMFLAVTQGALLDTGVQAEACGH
jgi:hypothetical protein